MLKNLEPRLNQDGSDDPPTKSGVGLTAGVQYRSSLCEGIRNGEHNYVGWLTLNPQTIEGFTATIDSFKTF